MRYKDMTCGECPFYVNCPFSTNLGAKVNEECINAKISLEQFVDSEAIKLTAKKPKKIESSPAFEEFWKVYPRHDGKAAAIKVWHKVYTLSKSPVSLHSILTGAEKYAEWIAATGKQDYIAMASTWLNGERWNDELKIPTPTTITKTSHEDIFNESMEQVKRMTANDG